jgi:hypothetical protein
MAKHSKRKEPYKFGLAMKLWVVWRDNPEVQKYLPHKLVIAVMCALAPHHIKNILEGPGNYFKKVQK